MSVPLREEPEGLGADLNGAGGGSNGGEFETEEDALTAPCEHHSDPASAGDLDAVSLYLREAGRCRRLTRREERQLSGSLSAAQAPIDETEDRSPPRAAALEAGRFRLVEGNLGLVVSIAHHYEQLGLPLDDLIQEGNLALIAAARTFDPALGLCFCTHAVRWIRQGICRALSQQSRTVRIPLRQLELRRRAAGIESELEQRYRNEECTSGEHHVHTTEDDARALGVDPEALRSTIRLVPDVESLDAPRTQGARPLGETIADSDLWNPCDAATASEARRQLGDGIGHLPPRLQLILKRRFGLAGDGEAGLAEIGEELHVSAERVRQLQRRALGMLRRDLERTRRLRTAALPAPLGASGPRVWRCGR